MLTVYGLGTTIQISVSASDYQQRNPLIPDLYDARLVTMNGAKMLFAGIKRTIDPLAAQYLQEWAVVIVSL